MSAKEDLEVQILQARIEWHKPESNLAHFETLLSNCPDGDVIVLPEMWNTGFTMKAELYARYAKEALDAMKRWSSEYSKAIVASVIMEEEGRYYNRLYFVSDGNVLAQYDKRHLFAYSGEDRSFEAGKEKVIVEYKGWRFCLNICYDLRFPVWARNYEDYDILIYSANWPDARQLAWQTLLRARAIENQSYVLGANCFGNDAWKNNYSGHSYIYSFDGSLLTEEKLGEQIFSCQIKSEALTVFRERFPFIKERDKINGDWKTSYFTDSK